MSGSPDLVLAVFHFVEYLGLLGGVGSFVVRRLARMRPGLGRWADPPMHIAFGLAVLGGLGLFALGPSLLLAARVVAEGVALILCLRGQRLVAVFGVLAAVLLPLTGHASGVPDQAAGAELADVLHVLSAAIWAGAILAMATLRPPGGWSGQEARTLLDRFSRIALIAFGVTALTGLLRATEQLTEVSDLWTTPYGRVLMVKAAGIVAMLALSLAWRRGWPAARYEAAAAGLVVAATALLAAFPLPAIG